MDVDRPEPGGAPRVVVVELEHVRGRASGKRRAGATLFCGYRFECPPLASRPACLPVINQTSTLHASNAAGWLAHAPTQTATAGPHVRVRSAPPATVPLCARADDIAPKRRWSTTFARLDHIPARASGNDAVQNELQRSRYRRNSDKDSFDERQRYLSTRCFAREAKHPISSIRQHSSGDYDRSGTRGVCSQPARLSSGRF